MIFALPMVALLCIAGLALSSDAALLDNETQPDHEQQYYDWDHAYVMSTLELGSRLEVRKDGGGDDDYLKLPFLNVNDMITVNVNQSEPSTAVEYWVSDPDRFPIIFHHYTGPPMNPIFSLEFAAVVPGAYFIHTGQGFGDTFINFTITRQPMSPPAAKDSNNKPNDMVRLTDGVTHREDAGLPWDPSDFFFLNIAPSAQVNKYLTIDIAFEAGTKAQWELYDSTGIQRPKEPYSSDAILFGSGIYEHKRITETDDYVVRVWMMEGYGQYNLTVSVLSYPNDEDNSIDEATLVMDNTVETGDVNLSFDHKDFYEIYLEVGQPLWVKMTPTNGPADVYVYDDSMNQKDASRRPGLEVDFDISPWKPDEDGFYYIVVEAIYEPPQYEFPPTVTYSLEVWINYAPDRVRKYDPTPPRPPSFDPKYWQYHIDEDTIDEDGYDVSVLFTDKDEDNLTYELDMSYNDTLVDIWLQGNNFLYIEPKANASGFKVEILINATDPHDLMVNYTAFIWIDPVNDEPTVDLDEGPFEVTMGEDLVKSGVNVTKAFRDIDDDYSTWTFVATSTPHIKVELDEQWLATFTPQEENWFGDEDFTVTCTDKEGLTATITFTISMYEINDPPMIAKYISPIDMLEEGEYTIDLEDPATGPYFIDPEGKPLTYHFADNGTIVGVSIVGSVVTFTGLPDQVGLVSNLKIWAEDDLNLESANITVIIDVINQPDGPEVEALIETIELQEGDSVTFAQDIYYSFEDIDSTPFELTWEWYVDDEKVSPENISDRYAYEYTATVTAEKDRTVIVKLVVIDGDLPPAEAVWTVEVANKNAAPDEPTITVEGGKTTFKEGQSITFSATGSDLDGDPLTYKWFLDELKEVGTGTSVTLKDVEPGSHKVTVEVTDPSEATNTMDFQFKVEKKGGGGDDSPGFGVALAALAVLTLMAIMAGRRRR